MFGLPRCGQYDAINTSQLFYLRPFYISYLRQWIDDCILIERCPAAGGSEAMTHTHSESNQNQIQKSMVPMLRTWVRSIGWTVLLSALLAVLFALAVQGCAGIR